MSLYSEFRCTKCNKLQGGDDVYCGPCSVIIREEREKEQEEIKNKNNKFTRYDILDLSYD